MGELALIFMMLSISAFDTGQHYLAFRCRLGALYWLFGGEKFSAACKFGHSYAEEIVLGASNTLTVIRE